MHFARNFSIVKCVQADMSRWKKKAIISLWIYGIAGRCFIGVCWTWQNNLPVLPKTNAMAAAIKNHDNNYAGVFVLRWTCVLFSGVCLDIVRWAVTEWHDGRYQPGACYSTCCKITHHWCAPSWQKWIALTIVPLRWLQEARVGEGAVGSGHALRSSVLLSVWTGQSQVKCRVYCYLCEQVSPR